MNKTSISWTDVTWNPVSGCFHSCRNQYCYNTLKKTAILNRFGARYIDERGQKVAQKDWRRRETGKVHIAGKSEAYPYGFDPTFYPHRLKQPLNYKTGSKVFVVNVGDLFGEWIPSEWVEEVLSVVRRCPQHTFQFLTKNPKRYLDFDFPKNAWLGTSVNRSSDRERIEILKKVIASVRFLSIEPLLGSFKDIDFTGLQWLILGAQTGNNPIVPEADWVTDIVIKADQLRIPLFIKENMMPYWPCESRQFPG